MGLQQLERRLERLVEGIFARAFRSGLQPVEITRRLTREMDLRRTVASRGTLTPNEFTVALSPEDRDRFAPIEDELIDELIAAATEHARTENYVLLGPVLIHLESDGDLSPGTLMVAGEMVRAPTPEASLALPDGRRLPLGEEPFSIGRLPECGLVLSDPNVSRRHAEIRPALEAPGEYSVRDLGSTNGTKVNGLPISGGHVLRPGDQITVGATTVRFERQ
ncbi:MAG: FhaA domain-containing protein [Acidimicrobiales bacterium]